MNTQYPVRYLGRPLSGVVRPPGSKSITNRALICAAAADGESRLLRALRSEDTQMMIEGLNQLGVSVSWQGDDLVVRGGTDSVPRQSIDVFVGNSGTTIRFLSALAAAIGGSYKFDGIQRMRMRPIEDLADAFRQLGVRASCTATGCPPLELVSSGFTGNQCSVRGNLSSQYLSGLLMASVASGEAVQITVEGELVSKPYVDITLDVMKAFGAAPLNKGYHSFEISKDSKYLATEYAIEPDASAASYFFAVAAVTGGRITVSGLSADAMQGDIAFCNCLADMGCTVIYDKDAITVIGGSLNGIDVDMNAISDTVPTLAVVALFANGPTNISNVEHVRHKETDRISDLSRELVKLGATVDERQDGLTINPGELRAASIATYNDHRIAMSFAVAGLMIRGVVINDPGCCEKTYPEFFSDLEKLINQDEV